jgi:rhodanese-related sulfurtransferase
MKKDFLRIILIVTAAFVVAVVGNAFAGREKKLLLGGFYPDPYKVPSGQKRPGPDSARAVGTSGTTATEVNGVPSPSMTTTGVNWITTTNAASTTATTTSMANVAQPPSPVVASATTAPVASATTTTAPATKAPATAAAPAVVTSAPEPTVDLAKRFPAHPDKAYLEVGYADVALLHRSGALILDARRSAVFEDGHIAGSRSFSVWESDVDDKVNALFNERGTPDEQAQPIVIYCSGGACEDSHMLAQKLWGAQFNNVLVYKDGYPDWVKRGGATRTGR